MISFQPKLQFRALSAAFVLLTWTFTSKKKSLNIRWWDAENVIGNQKSGVLSTFFKRIGLKKGRDASITVTARIRNIYVLKGRHVGLPFRNV